MFLLAWTFLSALLVVTDATKYEILMQTGTFYGAGTDANVFIILYGTRGSSSRLALSSNKDIFENGDVDNFNFNIADIGPVTRIRVGHDNSGWFSDWYLEKVEIKYNGSSNSIVFKCNTWISESSGLTQTFLANTACGLTLRPSSRIVGGTNALPGQWPWQVSVSYSGRHWCGGSIINTQWIVSAAHCFHNYKNAADYKITVGDHDLRYKSKYEQVIGVDKIVIHSGYDNYSSDNDIAMLKLKTPIQYNRQALPVCLASTDLPAGTKCWITGWGTLTENGFRPAILQQAEVPLVSKRACSYVYGFLTKSMRCAGYFTGKIDACKGDSGGPLVCSVNGRWNLIGAVSWGVGCARPGHYGVYADIVHLKTWITSVM